MEYLFKKFEYNLPFIFFKDQKSLKIVYIILL